MPEITRNSRPALSRPAKPAKPADRKRRRERRLHIAAIVLLVCGLLTILSILSYSRRDEAPLDRASWVDIARFPFDAAARGRAAEIDNRLGLIGALVSDFFINSTTGYSSIVFPLLMVLWGWVILMKRDPRKPLTLTNYGIILSLLVSASFGVSNLVVAHAGREWSGAIGAYAADVLTKLLGGAGSIIVLLTALLIAGIFAADLDLRKTLDRFHEILGRLRASLGARFARGQDQDGPGPDRGVPEVTILTPDGEEMAPPRQILQAPSQLRPDPDQSVQLVVGEEDTAVLDDEMPAFSTLEAEPKPAEIPEPVSGVAEPEEIDYVFPSVELLDPPRHGNDVVQDDELKANAELVRSKLANFGVEIESVSVTPGPVITLYELVPASGVKISRIVSLADDLALALAAKGIRIMAPIPGKSAVGVEIPNRNPSIVYLRSVLNSTAFRESKAQLPVAFGKTISGDVCTDDLSRMPHLLIAGSTGSGKSVGINTLLASLLFRLHPSDVKLIIIDPKKIELAQYGRLRNHFLALSPDIDEDIVTTPENAVSVLRSVELEMERRYHRLASAGVRNILDYNDRLKSNRLKNTGDVVHRKMPYLVVIIDELADLMLTAAREVEEPIARLAQMARAVGVHLVFATQRPSVDVITGVIKANFPARIAYQVASKTDSRTILDMNGAEQLLGLGDMLYQAPGSGKPVRLQNAYISTEEVERLTEHIGRQPGYRQPFHLPSNLERKRGGLSSTGSDKDEFFEEAARLIVRHQQGSVSLLQRRLKVGYSRAARLVDELEAAGVVGPFDGSKAREVLIENDEQLEMLLKGLE